jgi:hypothetical protein
MLLVQSTALTATVHRVIQCALVAEIKILPDQLLLVSTMLTRNMIISLVA